MSESTPSLYEWMGGIEALTRLTQRFYERVPSNPLLTPIFAHVRKDHPQHVAAFLAEVLGGPADYSAQHGGHAHMIRQHLNRHLTHAQRREWVALLLDTADELKVPDDPEFRSALVGYLEWGSRFAVINSQPGVQAVEYAPMPQWGWGEVKGPYQPAGQRHELAQLNIAVMRAPLDSPLMADFVANLDRVNALADVAPGFVWRLQTEEEDATDLRPFGEAVLVNLSVWKDIDSLTRFVYRSGHADMMKRRNEWFDKDAAAYLVLWWVPAGLRPTVVEAAERLALLRERGPRAEAFGFGQMFAAP